MTQIETTLRRSYAEAESPAPDIPSLLNGARRRGRALRRRRRALVAVGAAAAVGAAVVSAQLLSSRGSPPGADIPVTQLPVPAGPQLTVYRYASSTGHARVVSFLDVRGRWCVGTVQMHDVLAESGDYRCADAELMPGKTGFGRVTTRTDDFTYDGVRRWMLGVATADVARVTVVLTDGSTHVARVVQDDAGGVFAVPVTSLTAPAFYRAYDARGHLVEQLRVPRSAPHDPFVDWRQVP